MVNANYEERLLVQGQRMPLMIAPRGPDKDLPAYLSAHRSHVLGSLQEHGAILFRGFDVRTAHDFSEVVDATGSERMEYNYRSTPRSEVEGKIYTATEYPASETIPLHNENSYQRVWPRRMALCCLTTPQTGGETPIADMRKVTKGIGKSIFAAFEERKVLYVRHFRPHVDIPWQVAFQTSNRDLLEEYCASEGIEHNWLESEVLQTRQVAQGCVIHPVTGEPFYFNQAHLFHVSSLGARAELLIEMFGIDRLPRHAYFGDGTEISAEDLLSIRSAFEENKLSFPWQQGDVLLVDNIQVSHGRGPFTGSRKVLVSLLDPSYRTPAARNSSMILEHQT